MTDAITRISALLAELRAAGCDVQTDAGNITVSIRWPGEPAKPAPAEPPPAPTPRVTETRKRDHSISPITGAKRRGGPAPTVDYAEVARVAREAIAADQPIGNAVAEYYRIASSAADMRIRKARELGHDIPATRRRGGRPTSVTPAPKPAPAEPARTPLDEIERLDALADGDDD